MKITKRSNIEIEFGDRISNIIMPICRIAQDEGFAEFIFNDIKFTLEKIEDNDD